MGRNPFRLKQVSVRLKAERPLLSETPVKNPEDVARLVKELVFDFDREAVCIISLKNDLSPINFSICSIGSLKTIEYAAQIVYNEGESTRFKK